MIRIITLLTILFLVTTTQGQTLLAKWTFPTGTPADSMPDGGIAANLGKAIRTGGGTSALDFTKNGYTTKSAQATGWDNGMDTKYWLVEISTLGYEGVTLASRQQSGGNNPGPRDWKAQYKAGTGGSWTDVTGSAITVMNDWTMGVIDSILLPGDCDDQAQVFIRWIMTSNTNSSGVPVTSNGIDKIDDIFFYGTEEVNGWQEFAGDKGFRLYPNPASGSFYISGTERSGELIMTDLSGRVVHHAILDGTVNQIDLSGIGKGIYAVRLISESSLTLATKIVVQ